MRTLIKQSTQSQPSHYKPSNKSHGHKQHNSHKTYNKSHHSKGKYRHNTRLNELGECTSDASSGSDQSDVGEKFDQQEPSTSDNFKKLGHPSQDSHSLPEPVRGHNTNSYTIRHDTSLDNNSCDNNVHSSIESKSQDVNSSVNNTHAETDIVHLGRRPQDECNLLFKLAKEITKLYGIQGQDNVYCLLIVIMLSLPNTNLTFSLVPLRSKQPMAH